MTTQYSYADIQKHNDNKSTWVVIHNSVYDVTSYLNEHPGGEDVLLEQAGKDGSEEFEDAGHSSDAKEVMLKYKIGEIVESERKPVKLKKADLGESSACVRALKWLIIPVSVGVVATILFRLHIRK